MKNIIADAQEALNSLSDVDKEALKVSGRVLGQSLVFSLTKVTIVHLLGRKIAPNVFKSWGRTFTVVSLIEAATNRYKISDGDKLALAEVMEAQRDQKLAEMRKFGA